MGSAHNEFVDYVLELMSGCGSVSARRMFGGYGLYREGLMFALIAEDELFFKADPENVARFEKAGSRPFVYQSQNKNVQLSYWSAPDASLDSPAEMREWCLSSFGSALRAQTDKTNKGKRK